MPRPRKQAEKDVEIVKEAVEETVEEATEEVEADAKGKYTVLVPVTQPSGPVGGSTRTFDNKKDAEAYKKRFNGEFT